MAATTRYKSTSQRIGTLDNQNDIPNNSPNDLPNDLPNEERKFIGYKNTSAKPPNVKKMARERVRSTTRRVQQAVQLGGYWTFNGGKAIFVPTTGRKVRGKKGPKFNPKKPNQTVNTAPKKKKEKLVKRPPKKEIPDNIKRIRIRSKRGK